MLYKLHVLVLQIAWVSNWGRTQSEPLTFQDVLSNIFSTEKQLRSVFFVVFFPRTTTALSSRDKREADRWIMSMLYGRFNWYRWLKKEAILDKEVGDSLLGSQRFE
jgi:hypothetical protein